MKRLTAKEIDHLREDGLKYGFEVYLVRGYPLYFKKVSK